MGSYYRPLVQSIFAPGMVAKVLARRRRCPRERREPVRPWPPNQAFELVGLVAIRRLPPTLLALQLFMLCRHQSPTFWLETPE